MSIDFSYFQVQSEDRMKFQCIQCDKVYLTKQALENHFSYVHAEKRTELICTYCTMSFNTRPLLAKHTWAKHKVTLIQSSCKLSQNCSLCTKV